MKKLLILLSSSVLLATFIVTLPSTSASAATTLITCTDLTTQKTVALKESQKGCKPLLATAIWHIPQSDGSAHVGVGYANLRTCTSKRAEFSYQLLKSKCAKYQNTNDYWRAVGALEIPIIAFASARGYDGAAFTISITSQITDAPTAYYLITNIKTGQINKVSPNSLGELSLSNLSPLSSYTFTIAAVSVDGISSSSLISPVITTGAVPVAEPAAAVTSAPALAAPAFTLTSIAETRTVNTAATGFTVSSTGGEIASFGISATPVGMSFSTSTGALVGTPTSVAGATAYTITATNASGSATRTFTLTVSAFVYSVGDTGPGGGKIFYKAVTPFVCGPTRTTTCTYLEAAPPALGLASFDTDTVSTTARKWANTTDSATSVNNPTSPETALATAIGWGYRNTRAIILQGNTDPATLAAALADSYSVTVSGVVYEDWYLPSRDELVQMCKWARGVAWTSDGTACGGGTLNLGTGYGLGAAGFSATYYWSSSELFSTTAYILGFHNVFLVSGMKSDARPVRPVRSF